MRRCRGEASTCSTFSWEGDITGRIILERLMEAANRGVRVRLPVDDPYYVRSDSILSAVMEMRARRSAGTGGTEQTGGPGTADQGLGDGG